MLSVFIIDASPLILLAKTKYLHLLTDMAAEVVVPEGVAAEVLCADSSDPARKALEAGFGVRYHEGTVPQSVVDWRLGPGDSAVLAIALSRTNCTAVLDDALARRCGKALGVRCIGTLGLIVGAKVKGQIPSAQAALLDLVAAGLWLNPALVRTVLSTVNESWPL